MLQCDFVYFWFFENSDCQSKSIGSTFQGQIDEFGVIMEDTYCDLFNPTVTNGTVSGTCRCSGSERCGTCTRGVQLSKGQCVLDQPVTNSRCSSEREGKPDDAGNKCDQHSIGTCTGVSKSKSGKAGAM